MGLGERKSPYSVSDLRETPPQRWGSERCENEAGGLFQHSCYGAGVVETGTAERDEEERSGFRDCTVTVRMGESGRGLLLAI